jgi:Flp pilus assembly protein TadD
MLPPALAMLTGIGGAVVVAMLADEAACLAPWGRRRMRLSRSGAPLRTAETLFSGREETGSRNGQTGQAS